MLKTISFILIMGLMASCNPLSKKKESHFGSNFRPGIPFTAPEAPTLPGQGPIGESTGFKISTGSGRLSGANGSARATILPNDRLIIGTQISGRFSINKSQVR